MEKISYICFRLGNPDVDRCNALVDAGYGVTVYNWLPDDEEYIWDNSLAKRFETVEIKIRIASPLTDPILKAIRLVYQTLFGKRSDIYIIYGYQRPYFFILAVAYRLFGRHVVSMNDSKFDDYPRSLFKELAKWILLLPYSGFLAASVRAQSYLQFFGRRKIELYYCAIDINRICADDRTELDGALYENRHFTAIARFIPKKNHLFLLTAYERYIATTDRPRRLILCGYGPLEGEIRDVIDKSPALSKFVEIQGYVDSKGVSDVLASSLALLLPSTEEQFGIVVTEALACGVPVILSEICGAADLIKNGVNGFKHEPDNEDGLCFYLHMLSCDESLWRRMSAAAPSFARLADISKYVLAVQKLTASQAISTSLPLQSKINVIYPFYPHYRSAILHSLNESKNYKFEFWGDHRGFGGIAPFSGDEAVKIYPLRSEWRNRTVRIFGYWKAVTDKNAKAVIIHGAPGWIDTWIMAIAARATGKAVLLWGHGWLRDDTPIKKIIKRLYYGLADQVLVYSDRAQALAVRSGHSVSKIQPIYNSLDQQSIEAVYRQLQAGSAGALRATILQGTSCDFLLVGIARLTALCRFDQLLQAMKQLRERGFKIYLILVGVGPEMESLRTLASELKLDVQFRGEMYDEELIGPLFYSADLTVSPGKVGLMAIHSLSYGTPVLTHGDLDNQMPEVEAIQSGETGLLFKRNDVEDLARCIEHWLSRGGDREEIRMLCRKIVLQKWNSDVQRQLIERALDNVLKTNSQKPGPNRSPT